MSGAVTHGSAELVRRRQELILVLDALRRRNHQSVTWGRLQMREHVADAVVLVGPWVYLFCLN